ncbi:MAG: glycosyltransferase [Candidatus Moranbacteria bacterium]|nr:glycosyltransferase [Candidatus Moranbacteria bacterium]
MNSKNVGQVFYNRSRLRWYLSLGFFFLFLFCIASVFSVTSWKIFSQSDLPDVAPSSAFLISDKDSFSLDFSLNSGFLSSALRATTFDQSLFFQHIGSDAQPSADIVGYYVSWDDNSFFSLEKNISHLDSVVAEWLHLDGFDGSVRVNNPDEQQRTLSFIQKTKPSLDVVALVNNYDPGSYSWNRDWVSSVLLDEVSRKKLVDSLLEYAREWNLSGVSVDFENLSDVDHKNYLVFLRELSDVFDSFGLSVSVVVPLTDDSFDATSISQIADSVILMAYDESVPTVSLSGPVASSSWISSALKKRYASGLLPEKTVVAFGGYGYDWIDGSMEGKNLTFQEVMDIAQEHQVVVSFDHDSGNLFFSYRDSSGQDHRVWFLDAVSLYNQISVVESFGRPRGYALWRLGSEDPSVWRVFPFHDRLDSSVAYSISSFGSGYDVIYHGEGEILQVTSTPSPGHRSVAFDASSGLIADVMMLKFPDSYVVTRSGGSHSKKVALTFDDGPDQIYTPQILDVLKENNVKATFFVVGTSAGMRPGLLQRMFSDGHDIGNHTFSHPDLTRVSDQRLYLEFDGEQKLFEGVLGRKTLLFRPPYAEDIEPETPEQARLLTLAGHFGYYTVGMHIDPKDWMNPGVDAVVQSIVDGLESGRGNVVLLHDGGGDRSQTVESLPRIIQELKEKGYEFVSVSELYGVPRDHLMPVVSGVEQIFSYFYGTTVYSFFVVSFFVTSLFLFGVYLGIGRFYFVAVLAIFQFSHSLRRRRRENRGDFCPFVSVVVPAYNEQKVVADTIDSLLASDYPSFEIIVVDDGSTDKTASVVAQKFSGESRVRLFTVENGGKSSALNFGISQSLGEIVITLDADTQFLPNTISFLAARFSDPCVGAVAGNAKVGNRINLLTRWQALEYITAQNVDRRAFEILNCIFVVPGAIGAWRREAVLAAGGFSHDTLAEDADLTLSLIRSGYRVVFEDRAIAYTEAPHRTRDFVKQRFRWMYGTMQVAWKNRDALFRLRYGFLGFFALPNTFLFQVIFPFFSPLMDLVLVISVVWASWQGVHHPSVSVFESVSPILRYYLLFQIVDLVLASLPFLFEPREQKSLLFWLPLQRFYYRQLMYYVAIKSVIAAVRGRWVGWNKFERTATVVRQQQSVDSIVAVPVSATSFVSDPSGE